MDITAFKAKMERDGWVVFPSVIEAGLIDRINRDLAHAYEVCRSIQVKNGIAANTDGSVHHILGLGDSFFELLEKKPLWDYMQAYFEGKPFILNAFTGIINLPQGGTYASNVHRDIRTFSGPLPLMLNTLVMLDDFTPDNGATYLGTGSHLKADKPTDKEFFATAAQAVGKAGSILFFNSNLWHAAGFNKTDKPRRCLTPVYSKPFMKQLCDYPRLLGYDFAGKLSDDMKQVLGYNARIPASLEEWYQPPEKRMYKPGQG